MKRHELTDEQWELLSPLIPPRAARTGRQVWDISTDGNIIDIIGAKRTIRIALSERH